MSFKPGSRVIHMETGEPFTFIEELSGGLLKVKETSGQERFVWAGHIEEDKKHGKAEENRNT